MTNKQILNRNTPLILLFLLLFHNNLILSQQKIGLVLSGGGASGMAHIGVIKALEEHNIPIDYITGTSAGAFIGALYAAGYSPQEMEYFILSEEYQEQVIGELSNSHRFYYREPDINSSLINLSFSKDSIFKRSLPLNFISPILLDYSLMKFLSPVNTVNNKNFDQLFVPFRCVASDVAKKKSIVFKSGDLNKAVRASMTYPFYLNPIKIDGVLYYDGGLYNNFPADIMYNDFNPDYIIGSNVSSNAPPPDENDLFGIVTNLLVSHTNFDLPCEDGIIIEPSINIGTFDFKYVKKAIDAGYKSTIDKIDSIKEHVIEFKKPEQITLQRNQFRKKNIPIKISSISHDFYKKNSVDFVKNSFIKNNHKQVINEDELFKKYFRLYASEHIDFLFPSLSLNKDSSFNLDIYSQKSKDFQLDIGGHFSSRPINTGYLGFQFRHVKKIASTIQAQSYFGKFYGSLKLSYKAEIPFKIPFSIKSYFVLNRWDYFRSFATFFEDVQPSFLVQNELYFGVNLSHPIGNNSKSIFDIRSFDLEDNYFQSDKFTNVDTTDNTNFIGGSVSWDFTYNTLNRKQFANSGNLFHAKLRYVSGQELTIPGSTSPFKDSLIKQHEWLSFNAHIQSFIYESKKIQMGVHAMSTINSQSLFSNYTASLLALPSFSILPDIETYFLPEYRSPQHIGGGINIVYSIVKNLELRLDAYFYQPFILLAKNEDGSIQYTEQFKGSSWLSSSSLVYHSRIGPIRATLNWFPQQENQFAFQFSYGYVLFNERAIR